MSRFVLHIGMPKAASSTLQRFFLLPHSQIYYLGKDVESELKQGCRSERVLEILDPLLWKRFSFANLDRLAEKYRKDVLPEVATGQIVVGSWEALANYSPRRMDSLLHRMNRVVDSFNVMLCLRNPLTWVPSMYLQSVQGHHIKRNRFGMFGNRPYRDFDAWLKSWSRKKGGDKNWLAHANHVRAAVSLLGPENVGVFLFEDLKVDPKAYYSSIADFLGVDKSEALDSALGAHRNLRLLQSELDFIRDIDASFWRRREWRKSSPRERRRRMKRFLQQSHDGRPAQVTLSEIWKDRISEATRESNAWLVSELGLELEKHGYPL